MTKKEFAVESRDVISLSALAERFSKAKGMNESGYQWLHKTPGRKRSKDDE